MKKIPGVGLIAGLGFAATRLMKGDALGALGEVASGAASILPGVGTAVSTAIDVGLAARDITKAVGTTAETVQDATKVQIKEREAIIQKEKSQSNLSKKQAEANKAAQDAIVEQKKAVEKEKAKMVQEQTKKPEVEKKAEVKKPMELDAATKMAFTKRLAAEKLQEKSPEELKVKVNQREETIAKLRKELADKAAQYAESGGGTSRAEKTQLRQVENQIQAQKDQLKLLLDAINAQTATLAAKADQQVKATQDMVND